MNEQAVIPKGGTHKPAYIYMQYGWPKKHASSLVCLHSIHAQVCIPPWLTVVLVSRDTKSSPQYALLLCAHRYIHTHIRMHIHTCMHTQVLQGLPMWRTQELSSSRIRLVLPCDYTLTIQISAGGAVTMAKLIDNVVSTSGLHVSCMLYVCPLVAFDVDISKH